LRQAPEYVLHFVIYHEAIHLQHSDHGEDFYQFLHRYPKHKEAEAFLDGFEYAERI
jgi:predicted metal-dependent hydrolase